MRAPSPIAEAMNGPEMRIDYVPRGEALRILCVKPQTLYSYVSRGLVRRLASPDSRTSYYSRQDIQRLKARSLARSGHGPAAASAMHWGEPILTTAITEITENGPRYRNHLAVNLAKENFPFEAVAEYLWTGEMARGPVTWHAKVALDGLALRLAEMARLRSGLHIRHLLTQVILLLDTVPIDADSGADHDVEWASTLIRAMTGAFGFLGPSKVYCELHDRESIAHGVTRALGMPPSPRNIHALNTAFVLIADHEFTPPTFAARIAASGGSALQSCIVAGLEVHFGTVLGLGCDRLEQFLDLMPSDIQDFEKYNLLTALIPTGPGFGHPLYLHGDPRAKMLLEIIPTTKSASHIANTTMQALEPLFPNARQCPNLSVALVVLCRALGLPHQAAGGLLALGRSAGWIAHVLEQRRQGFLIRPRGKFVSHHSPDVAV
jgi:citrate synthase